MPTAPIILTSSFAPSAGGGGGAVDSVFGRTGAVVSGIDDYSKEQVNGLKLADVPAFSDVTVDNGSISLELGQALASVSRTGVIDGGVPSVDVDTTEFSIEDGTGIILDPFTDPDNPTWTGVSWTGKTGIPIANFPVSYIYADINGDIQQQATDWTTEDFRDKLILGTVVSFDGVNIDLVAPFVSYARGQSYLAQDYACGLGELNVSGNSYSNSSTDLKIKKTGGVTIQDSINSDISDKTPNDKTSLAEDPLTFNTIRSDGSGSFITDAGLTDINTTQMDDLNGGLIAIPNNKWVNINIAFYPGAGNQTTTFFPQIVYDNAETALANRENDALDDFGTNSRDNIRTLLTVKKGTTDLSPASGDAFFNDTGLFGRGGGVGGQSGIVQDQQSTYNVSEQPQTTTDAVRGAVQTKVGTGTDTDKAIEVLDGSDNVNYSIDGEGRVETVGLISSFVAGETISTGEACYLDSSREAYKADISDVTKSTGQIFIALEDVTATNSGRFTKFGNAPKRALASNFTVNAKLYLSTGGELTETATTVSGYVIREIGTADTTAILDTNVSTSWSIAV